MPILPGAAKISCLIAVLLPIVAVGCMAEFNDVETGQIAGTASPQGLPSAYDGELLFYVANNSTDDLLVTNVNSSGSWNGNAMVGDHASVATPAYLQPFASTSYLVFVGSDGHNELNIASSSSNGLDWGKEYVIPGVKTQFAPAAACLCEQEFPQLAIAYVVDDGTDDLYVIETTNLGVSSTASALKWGTPVKVVGQKSKTAPAMTSFHVFAGDSNPLVLAYVADNASNDLLITTSKDGIHWTADTQVKGPEDETPQQTPLAPALITYVVCCSEQETLLLAYVANNGSNDLFVTTSTDALNWTKSSPVQGQQSSVAPALQTPLFAQDVMMAYVANNGSHDLLVTTSSDGIHWSGSSPVGTQTSKAAPALGYFIK